MVILGISLGYKESCACITDTSNILGNAVFTHDLCVIGDARVIPTTLAMSEDGDYYIPSSAYDYHRAVKRWEYFISPIDMMSDENITIFKTYINILFNSIFSNTHNPIIPEGNRQIYLNIEDSFGWSYRQIVDMEKFVKNECGIEITKIVKSYEAIVSNLRNSVCGGIRTNTNGCIIIHYTDSILEFVYNDGDSNNCSGYHLGASQIDYIIYDYMVTTNPENEEIVSLLKEIFPKKDVVECILKEISKWRKEGYSLNDKKLEWPSIHVQSLFLDKSLTGLYFEMSADVEYTQEYFKHIISSYIVKLYDACREFRKKIHKSSNSIVCLTGEASRMPFISEIVETVFNVTREEDNFWIDIDPSLTLASGTAIYGCRNYLEWKGIKSMSTSNQISINNNLKPNEICRI